MQPRHATSGASGCRVVGFVVAGPRGRASGFRGFGEGLSFTKMRLIRMGAEMAPLTGAVLETNLRL